MDLLRPPDNRLALQHLAHRRGHRHAAVLGPFDQPDGPPHYTVALYDDSGRVHRETLQGTYNELATRLGEPGAGAGGNR